MTEVILLCKLFLELKFDKLEFQSKIEFSKFEFQFVIPAMQPKLIENRV